MIRLFTLGILGAFVAIFCAVWLPLEIIIEKLVSSESQHPGLVTLRIAHQMAGGPEWGASASLASAIKETFLNSIFGPPETQSRLAWRRMTSALQQAGEMYLSPTYRIGLGPDGASETAGA